MAYVLTTTYRYDFLTPPPPTTKYKLNIKAQRKTGILCNSCKTQKETPPPKSKANKEWTGIAQMGRLLTQKVFPNETESSDNNSTKITNNKNESKNLETLLKSFNSCFNENSKVNLLKDFPTAKHSNNKFCHHHFSTYKSDFCKNDIIHFLAAKVEDEQKILKQRPAKITAFIEIECPSMAGTDTNNTALSSAKSKKAKALLPRLEECEAIYKPIHVNFAEAPNLSGKIDLFWHPNPYKRPITSEYRDIISRNGCVITTNRINDHSNCKPDTVCTHRLIANCRNYS